MNCASLVGGPGGMYMCVCVLAIILTYHCAYYYCHICGEWKNNIKYSSLTSLVNFTVYEGSPNAERFADYFISLTSVALNAIEGKE